MQNKQYNKQAILTVLKYLKKNEPECKFCDHCLFFMNKTQCFTRQERIKKEHQNWEQKIKKWEERLQYAK